MAARIEINHDAFRAMAVGDEMRAAVTAEARRAESIAKALSEDFRVTGGYIDGFIVEVGTSRLKTEFGEHDVATGILLNLDPHAAAVEWGNKRDHRPHHVLTRTLDALGNG